MGSSSILGPIPGPIPAPTCPLPASSLKPLPNPALPGPSTPPTAPLSGPLVRPGFSFKQAILATHPVPPAPPTSGPYRPKPFISNPALPLRPPRFLLNPSLQNRCFRCFEKGHQAVRCREPRRCLLCMRIGHPASRCNFQSSPSQRQPMDPMHRSLEPGPSSGRPSLIASFLQTRLPSPGLPSLVGCVALAEPRGNVSGNAKEILSRGLAARFGGSSREYLVATFQAPSLAVFFPNWVTRGSAIGRSPFRFDGIDFFLSNWTETAELGRGHLSHKAWIRLHKWPILCWNTEDVRAAVSGFGELWDTDPLSDRKADVSFFRALVRCQDVHSIPEAIALTVDDRRFHIPVEIESWEQAAPILLSEELDDHLGLDSVEAQNAFIRQSGPSAFPATRIFHQPDLDGPTASRSSAFPPQRRSGPANPPGCRSGPLSIDRRSSPAHRRSARPGSAYRRHRRSVRRDLPGAEGLSNLNSRSGTLIPPLPYSAADTPAPVSVIASEADVPSLPSLALRVNPPFSSLPVPGVNPKGKALCPDLAPPELGLCPTELGLSPPVFLDSGTPALCLDSSPPELGPLGPPTFLAPGHLEILASAGSDPLDLGRLPPPDSASPEVVCSGPSVVSPPISGPPVLTVPVKGPPDLTPPVLGASGPSKLLVLSSPDHVVLSVPEDTPSQREPSPLAPVGGSLPALGSPRAEALSTNRSAPAKLFSSRRSLRLAAKCRGAKLSSLQRAQEIMCKKIKMVRFAATYGRAPPTSSASPPPASARLVPSDQAAFPTIAVPSPPPSERLDALNSASKNSAVPLSPEEVRLVLAACGVPSVARRSPGTTGRVLEEGEHSGGV